MIRAMMGRKKQGTAIDGAPNGVYILRTDNRLYTRDEWSTAWNAEAVGVAVISDNCKFVIAPEQNSDRPSWGKGGARDYVYGVTTTTNISTAESDYKGVQNSAAMVSRYGNSTDYSAGWCQNYTFKNGKKGYLGSCGEWKEASGNRTEINACMSLIGGTAIAINLPHWTSTQRDSINAWLLYWGSGIVVYYDYAKDGHLWARAFAVL